MRFPDRDQQRKLVQQWTDTSRRLERIRRDALRGMPYNWVDVDALLDLGVNCAQSERTTSGLIEMQRLFMKAAPK